MAETRIDTPRSVEPRTGKASGQSMASAKSAGADAAEQVPAFASLLARQARSLRWPIRMRCWLRKAMHHG